MAAGNAEVEVPPTLKALLAARLDQLDEPERRVLERGSVEGEIFHRGAVQALAPEETQVTTRLAALVRRQLVRPDRAQLAGDDGYRFRHLLIRDAAYDALPKAVRADLHARFADWLDEHGDALVERDEIVGYHLEQAARYRAELGRPDSALAERAAVRLATAGRRANDRLDDRAALALLTRAVELLRPHRLDLALELEAAWAHGRARRPRGRRGCGRGRRTRRGGRRPLRGDARARHGPLAAHAGGDARRDRRAGVALSRRAPARGGAGRPTAARAALGVLALLRELPDAERRRRRRRRAGAPLPPPRRRLPL